MSFVKHAVIAAAGLGSGLGLGLPKCLLHVAGKPIIYYQLKLLQDIPDVRIVVGFEEHEVIAGALKYRPDVIFVRNAAFRSTSTLDSYALGARNLSDGCLFMDADILFSPSSFHEFIECCKPDNLLVAYTEAKTVDAVYTHVDGGRITKFSREERTRWEWANLCWLPPKYCENSKGAVFERLSQDLPVPSLEVVSYEIDRQEDLETALTNLDLVIVP